MFTILNFQTHFYSFAIRQFLWLLLLFFVIITPAQTQNLSPVHRCQIFERELHDIGRNTRYTPNQAKRFHQLSLYKQQAQQDARRFSCIMKRGKASPVSDECHYIMNAQKRIDIALYRLTHQATTPQQQQMRRAIYQNMQQYQCRNPQELRQLLRDNRPRRISKKQIYKKTKPVVQATLQRPAISPKPAIIQQDYVSEEMKARYAPSKPAFEHFVNPAPQQVKAAENTPPPVIAEPVDYVPDSNIRRVGPVYLPDQ